VVVVVVVVGVVEVVVVVAVVVVVDGAKENDILNWCNDFDFLVLTENVLRRITAVVHTWETPNANFRKFEPPWIFNYVHLHRGFVDDLRYAFGLNMLPLNLK
jgi:hypothetical protein